MGVTTELPADAPTFDLQSHSIYSDGHLPPAQVVALAAAAGEDFERLAPEVQMRWYQRARG